MSNCYSLLLIVLYFKSFTLHRKDPIQAFKINYTLTGCKFSFNVCYKNWHQNIEQFKKTFPQKSKLAQANLGRLKILQDKNIKDFTLLSLITKRSFSLFFFSSNTGCLRFTFTQVFFPPVHCESVGLSFWSWYHFT